MNALSSEKISICLKHKKSQNDVMFNMEYVQINEHLKDNKKTKMP